MPFAAEPPPEAAWVWTLHESRASAAFSLEVPDTDRVRAVLECRAGSRVVRVTSFQLTGEEGGWVRLSAAGLTAVAEDAGGGRDHAAGSMPVDHPAFQAFVSTGRMTVRAAGGEAILAVPPAAREALSRFARLCG